MPKKNHKRPRRFNVQRSFMVASAFVVIFGAIGAYLLFISHAATAPVELELSFNRGICLDNYHSSTTAKTPIDIWGCNGTYAQEWTLQSVSGGFLMIDGQGTCADDTGDNVGTSSSNRVYLQTYVCNSADHAQIWRWSGNQLQNAYNNGCINDPGNSTSYGQQLIIYPCSPVTSNAQWVAVTVAAPVPSVSVSSPANGATVSGKSVLVSGRASIPSGSITNITLKAAGNTLGSCANATSCFTGWNTTSLNNGNYTVQVTATGSGGGSATASITVAVNNAPPPSSGGGGSGGGSSGGGSSSGGGGTDSGGGSTDSGGTYVDTSGISTDYPSVSVDGSGGSTDSLGISTDGTTDNSGGDLGVTDTPTDSLNGTNGTASGPTVYDILATKITSSTISLSWQTSDANAYVVQYGTNQNNLTAKLTVKSTDAQPTLTLTKLPSNTRIYVSVTPKNGNASGAAISTSFQTLKSTSHVGAIISWTFVMVFVVVAALFIRRKIAAIRYSGGNSGPVVNVENLPVYPQEDTATQQDRLNWWMSDQQRQQMMQQQSQQRHNPADDIPDMFDEGRKRLQDEEGQNQNPNQQPPNPYQ